MFEELLVLAILAEEKLLNPSVYLDKLDHYFLEHSENNLLMELEFLYHDTYHVIAKIQKELANQINTQQFGQYLFKEIKEIYLSNDLTIQSFGQKMYAIWNVYLSSPLKEDEPFWTLSYADDCLSYGDVTQTRKLYEAAFNFYR